MRFTAIATLSDSCERSQPHAQKKIPGTRLARENPLLGSWEPTGHPAPMTFLSSHPAHTLGLFPPEGES